MTNNFISIGQTQVLKLPAVRKKLGLPKHTKPVVTDKFPKKEKSFREAFRDCKFMQDQSAQSTTKYLHVQ